MVNRSAFADVDLAMCGTRRTITVVRLDRRTTVDNSSGRMIRLKARIYTQTNYKTNYRSLPKFVPDG